MASLGASAAAAAAALGVACSAAPAARRGQAHRTGRSAWAARAARVLAHAKVGIFYATGTNTTKDLAYKIKEGLGDAADEPDKVMYLLAEDMAKYDALILGCPSYLWGGGSVSGLDFDTMVPPAGNPVDLQGVRVAVFGTGDQVKYSEYFADAMGMVADRMLSRGCIPIGQTSVEGYEFEYSRAQREDQFVGLVIDNENQPELTDVRVAAWVEQLKKEIGLPA